MLRCRLNAMTKFLTVVNARGGVAKTTTSLHLGAFYHRRGAQVLVVDADRNRSATKYAARGTLPFNVVSLAQAAKLAREADVVITDSQASPDRDEVKDLAEGSDLVIIPCAPAAGSYEQSLEISEILKHLNVQHVVLLVMVDVRGLKVAEDCRAGLESAGVSTLARVVRAFSAYQKAEFSGALVYEARTDAGKPDPNRNVAWSDYEAVGREIEEILSHA
jgi:chromosome partitioning protein